MGINTASNYISCTLYSYSQNQNGFVQLSSSFSAERISCSFVRSVLADNVTEDRNLNEAAYLLLAYGPDRGMYKWTFTRIMLSSQVLFAIYSLLSCDEMYMRLKY